MMKKRIAVPSMSPGGLEAQRSGHFGRCDVFTLVDIEDNEIKEISSVENVEHEQGGCLRPVELLLMQGVKAIVVGGMGYNPLMGFRSAGIDVLIGTGTTVQEAVDAYLAGNVPQMTDNHVCGGH